NYDYSKLIEKAFAGSLFSSKDLLVKYLNNPDKSLIENDELYKISGDLLAKYREQPESIAPLQEKYAGAYRKLVAGLRASKLSPIAYPDANSTLRLTYGTVKDLPRGNKVNDAKENWYTTLDGTIAKNKPGDAEF